MEEDIEIYKNLPAGTGVLLKMNNGEVVELISHFNENLFSGIYESRRYDNHDYHLSYNDIDSIICL